MAQLSLGPGKGREERESVGEEEEVQVEAEGGVKVKLQEVKGHYMGGSGGDAGKRGRMSKGSWNWTWRL